MMAGTEAGGLHLVHGLLGGPVLFGHAIGSDHHADTIVAEPAVDEDLAARVGPHQFQEASKRRIARKGAVPGQSNVVHPEGADLAALAVAIATEIDDQFNAEVVKLHEAFVSGLAAAIEMRRDFDQIRKAPDARRLRDGCSRGTRWRVLRQRQVSK